MFKIFTDPSRCTNCKRCQLICSFQNYREFNLNKSHLTIVEGDLGVNKIEFDESCTKCHVCVNYCAYNALKFREET